jgi:glutamate dehydrogenase/leucine dehydrogenase
MRSDNMTKNKVAIVGMGNKGSSVYRVLRIMEGVDVIGAADLNMTTSGIGSLTVA